MYIVIVIIYYFIQVVTIKTYILYCAF